MPWPDRESEGKIEEIGIAVKVREKEHSLIKGGLRRQSACDEISLLQYYLPR